MILATVLTNQLPGTPVWLFIVGNSGDWKTTFTQSICGLSNVIKIDQLTENTLASGSRNCRDLGQQLQDKSTILFFPDMASLTSMNKDKKAAIWGQFRNLYDGCIYKRTGGEVSEKSYENCHVTIIACTTHAIRNEILIHAQLGTRELMFDTMTDPVDDRFKMEMAIQNEQYEQQMKNEMQEVTTNFLHDHKINRETEVTEDTLDFLMNEAERLSILRASVITDQYYKECISTVKKEVPTRLIKVFKRLYLALRCLDPEYPEEKARRIISRIVDSSGNEIRQAILKKLFENTPKRFTIPEMQQETRLGRTAVKSQLEMLWNMNIIDKETVEEVVGGWERQGERVGGRYVDVDYYSVGKVTLDSYPPSFSHLYNIYRGGGMKGNHPPLETFVEGD